MTELERRLVALGGELEFPPTPDLASAVRGRLGPAGRRWARRPALGLALIAIALTAALAIPPARSALLRLFGIGSVQVVRVDSLPRVPVRPDLDLGSRVSLGEARRRLGRPLLIPGAGEPDAVFIRGSYAAQAVVSLLYGEPHNLRLLLTDFPADSRDAAFLLKRVSGETTVEPVRVGDHPGFWFHGAPHVVSSVDADGTVRERTVRLAANTLVWRRGGRTLRIEADVTRDRALELARSLKQVNGP